MTGLKGLDEMIPTSEIEIARKRIYSNYSKSKGFALIDDAELKRIRDLVKETNETHFAHIPCRRNHNKSFERYLAVMRFVGSSNTNDDLPTYDSKIAFLIETLDPNLEMYKIYLEQAFVTEDQIANELDEQKKANMIRSFEIQEGLIENNIRKKFGFFDKRILIYEAKYFKNVRKNEELFLNVNHDYFSKIVVLFNGVRNFDGVTEEENERVILLAEDYLSKYGKPSLNTLAFQLIWQKEILGISNFKEVIIFFILVMDKDLKLLDIYNEEANWNNIEKRSMEEFGFYNKNLILLEKDYQERFVPNYDPWYKNKKEIKFDD